MITARTYSTQPRPRNQIPTFILDDLDQLRIKMKQADKSFPNKEELQAYVNQAAPEFIKFLMAFWFDNSSTRDDFFSDLLANCGPAACTCGLPSRGGLLGTACSGQA